MIGRVTLHRPANVLADISRLRRRQRTQPDRRPQAPFDLIHDTSRLAVAQEDERQSARRRFIRDFRAAFPLRGENVERSLVEIILRVTHKADDANVITPELV